MSRSYTLYFFLLVFVHYINSTTSLASTTCSTNANCGSKGICVTSTGLCNCTQSGYVTVDSSKPCEYQQKDKLTAFLLSFFLGLVGADWFYLAAGSTGYIVAGVFKLLTGGGFGIWALVDWIKILTGSFPDGQGVSLRDWS